MEFWQPLLIWLFQAKILLQAIIAISPLQRFRHGRMQDQNSADHYFAVADTLFQEQRSGGVSPHGEACEYSRMPLQAKVLFVLIKVDGGGV